MKHYEGQQELKLQQCICQGTGYLVGITMNGQPIRCTLCNEQGDRPHPDDA